MKVKKYINIVTRNNNYEEEKEKKLVIGKESIWKWSERLRFSDVSTRTSIGLQISQHAVSSVNHSLLKLENWSEQSACAALGLQAET